MNPGPRLSLGLISLLIFLAIFIIYILLFGVFESLIVGLSQTAERLLAFVLLVLPAIVGAVLGALGLLRPGQNRLLAALGLVLNLLFGLFIACVLSVAG
jgi:hypothetical protein